MRPLKRYSLAVMTELALSDQAVHGTRFAADRLKRRGVSFALAHRILLGVAPSTSTASTAVLLAVLLAVLSAVLQPILPRLSQLISQLTTRRKQVPNARLWRHTSSQRLTFRC